MHAQPDLEGNLPPAANAVPNQLPSRLLDNEGYVIPGMWASAQRNGATIGTCRHCGYDLRPEPPIPMSQNRTDYVALCDNPTPNYRHEVAFPNGKTGRWDEHTKRGRRRPLPRGEKAITSNVPAYLQDGE